MLAAGGLLILMAMGYALGGMIMDGTDPTDTPPDDAPPAQDDVTTTQSHQQAPSLGDLLRDGDDPITTTGGAGDDSLTGGMGDDTL